MVSHLQGVAASCSAMAERRANEQRRSGSSAAADALEDLAEAIRVAFKLRP